ncbi:MAG: type IX secretion system protein PorQ [Reichenbachiella sp.]|uniref:type IX secretion system protein PorQ n=1 Tax=Reichenbachiella sp. TaxID=2184521 RepID=UPI00296632AC|nr:type IX secretion system protein PorQ [Reichenbachiella sp.]MDW3209254.1 type IX secretion system protein PorQ [Reichenbachiella sp.]
MKKPAFIFLLWIQAGFLFAQLDNSFQFLNLPIGARVAGLGGVISSSTDEDVNLFLTNPALLDSANDNHVSWSHLGFYADVKYNTLAYAKTFEKAGTFGVGIQHLGYGSIDSYDASGNSVGSFDASETAVVVSHSHQLSVFKLGANLKYVYSGIYTYNSSVLAMDIGGAFIHPEKEFMVSVLFKNLGFVMSEYSDTADSSLPTDLQIGLTFKPEHMPFRFSFTGFNLLNPNENYYDENLDEEKPGIGDRVFRHLNIGTEILFSRNFNIRLGYNHQVRKELSLSEKSGLSGMSMGLMARIKAFELSYTFTTYHVDSGRSYFTLTSNLNRVFKKKSII